MDFALTDEQQQIRDEVLKICAPFRRRLLAGARPDRDLSRRLLRRHGRRQLAGHRDAGGVWRRRPRHHRGGDPDAGGGRVRRLHVRRIGHPPQHIRPQPGGRVRHRGPEAPHAPPGDHRPRQGLLRRHRAECRAEHHADHHPRRPARRPLRDQWHQDLDVHRPGGEQDTVAGAHHAARSGEASQPRPDAVLHHAGPRACRGAADPQDGAARGRLEHGVLRGHGGARGGPDRRGRRGVPRAAARPQSRARAGGGRGDRHRPGGACQGGALRPRARRVRPSDRPEPGHPAPAGEDAGPSWRLRT